MKVFELAKELDIKALELVDKIKPLKFSNIKNHMSALEDEQVEKIREFLKPSDKAAAKKKKRVLRKKKKSSTRRSVVRRKASASSPEEDEAAEPLSPGETQVLESAEETTLSEKTVEKTPATDTEQSVSSPAAEEEAVPEEKSEEDLPVATAAAVAEPSTEEASAEASVKESVPTEKSKDKPVTMPRKRYSVIRVASNESPKRAKPLIVEAAQEDGGRSSAPRTFSDPTLARTGTELIQAEIDAEEKRKDKKRKSVLAPKKSTGTESFGFRSTDYLRRERIYYNKKRRISIGRPMKKNEITQAAAHKRVVRFVDSISLEEMARQMNLKARDLSKKLRTMGLEMPEEAEGFQDWYIDFETVQLVAQEFGFEARDESFSEAAILGKSIEDDRDYQSRSPVITIMGHVDHGKTSLLDLIRRSRVASGEAGGITQHIGAYSVTVDEAIENLRALQDPKKAKKEKKAKAKGKAKKTKSAATPKAMKLTFLDTPGHAAFTEMRSRGASVTDIVVLVVAATDGVMPQTKEAVDHAKAAGVPLIVAVNKMDLEEANPDRVTQQLSDMGVIAEDWGGDTIFVQVSAKTGMGVDKLLEMIQLQAEVMDLKAPFEGYATGNIVEAHLDKGRGPLATVLVQEGLLEVGHYIAAGVQSGKVRALIDDKGNNIKSAGPSTPVAVLGLDSVPNAGDKINSLKDEKSVRELVENRKREIEDEKAKKRQKMSLEEIYAKMNEGEIKELPLLVKADVRGSIEAIEGSLMKLPQDKVKIKILSGSVGAISESDVLLASASNAIILGFNVRPDTKAKKEAERTGVQLKTYDVIYNLFDEVKAAMEGMLEPTINELQHGQAEVRNVFNLSKSGVVAGCFVTSGRVVRSSLARLVRDGVVVYTGKISGLKRFKDDAKEVKEGFECGISLENFNDIKNGDVIESYTQEEIKGRLDSKESPEASAQA